MQPITSGNNTFMPCDPEINVLAYAWKNNVSVGVTVYF